jgi:hypothetical protein
MMDRAKATSLQHQVDYLEGRMGSMVKEHDAAVERVQTLMNQRMERMSVRV